ncbi:MAG: type II toxin-antitoxin system VapC family toxin [Planctomycetes bacterium]|nr:type II toxin-antitoxin system VapC family toxin [Planctomycetota bacterium]
MRSVAYVETSVISFYYETRPNLEMAARRKWTRSWWDSAVQRHDLVTGAAVIEELRNGDYPNRDECLALVASLPLLAVEPAVIDIVDTYIHRHVMPADPAGDALHLALASFHRCDFLVTWNCKHLANANKFGHIRTVNALLGLYVPAMVTPLELSEEVNDGP